MAEQSLQTAELALGAAAWRSSVSRAYYAAYQAATALLLYAGEAPPMVEGVQRESWTHAVTPIMVRENLRKIIAERARRTRMANSLVSLYKQRVDADYVSLAAVPAHQANEARTRAGMIVRTVRFTLGDGD